MKKDEIFLLKDGINTAFINKNVNSNLAYRPEFVINDYKEGKKVISSIEKELSDCDEFLISVAFITQSGVQLLLQILKELEEKGINGKILTTDYLTFSEPKALDKLNSFSNIEIRMFSTDNNQSGFHTKGYIFRKNDIYKMIIGSSNLTQNALSQNKEWNTKVVSTKDGQFADDVVNDFYSLWENEKTLEYSDFIENYRTKYEIVKRQKEQAKSEEVIDLERYTLKPNQMQTVFVENLEKLVDCGEKKALLVSATATGKTYASAFGVRQIGANRVLFIVHRETIAKQAMSSFRKVFGTSKTFGLLSGNSKNSLNSDFLFSTMQMMCKEEIYSKFNKNEFDVIIIDEAHRAGANSYQKIMNYFEPNLWLGMTASPERTDDFDIYNLFDHNIAYEIRLQQALEYDLLCPFHYFGISDLEVNGKVIDDSSDFTRLTCDERIKHIIEKIEFYGYCGDRAKGLIFCSTIKEAEALSKEFNKKGYRTASLTGIDNQDTREDYMNRLESDTREDYLEYIFSVDIFNEGVDIPQVNQIVMLRPTQSPIIFVQQLGRGLRKASGKEYVVILDFIGNYNNNYMIPIALSGDRTYKKDNLRRYLLEGTRTIPGCSTVQFDTITKERIFRAIDKQNFSNVQVIKDSYEELKRRIGKIPDLCDFITYESIDPQKIFDNNSLKSYHAFLKNHEKEYKYYKDLSYKMDETKENMLSYISTQFADGKRLNEIYLLELILNGSTDLFGDLEKILLQNNTDFDENAKINLVNIFTNSFLPAQPAAKYVDCIMIEKRNNKYVVSKLFENMLSDEDFKAHIISVIKLVKMKFEKEYSNTYKDSGFKLYEKYTYHDVCRILNWHKDEVSLNIGGYKYNKDTNTYPVYINYEKSDDIQETIQYEDEFIDDVMLKHISKSKRDLNSPDVKQFLNADETKTKVELFVRKNKEDKGAKEFYYLGRIHPSNKGKEIVMKDGVTNAVEMIHTLEVPVREDIYDYITQQVITEE